MLLIKKIVIAIYIATIFPLNLSLIDYHDPQANHMLDAEIIGNTLIVSAMLQGIELYEILDDGTINHQANFRLSQGGQGGGQGGTKANCVEAINDYAYFTSSNGLYIVDISNSASPTSLGRVNGTNNYILENLDAGNDFLAVAAHEDGVLIYDISNPGNLSLVNVLPADNAWCVRILNGYAYVGDNQNIKIYNLLDESNFSLVNVVETTNAIKDIALLDSLMYVAIGSDGVNVYDTTNPEEPILLDNFDTNTMANRISPFEGKLAVSDWDDVDILEWNGIDLLRVGYKNTGNRTMAIATKNNFLYSAEWASVQVFSFGQIVGPDIDLSTLELNYPFVDVGDSFSMFFDVINNGLSDLIINDDYTTNNHFEVIGGLNELQPGESQAIEIIYNASSENSAGVYRIYTNDSDEPLVMCEVNGNIDGANIGEPAIDFNLNYVANGNGSFRLSDQLGKIVVVAFFAPN